MKSSKLKNAIISSSIILSMSGYAFADMKIYSAKMERSVAEAKTDARYGFYQSGISNEKSEMVNGFGSKMPLMTSIQAIVPKGEWKVDMNEGADNILVDWTGNQTWPYVLENIARNNNLKISIDWSSKVIDVFSQDVEDKRLAAIEKAKVDKERARVAAVEKAAKDKLAKEKARIDKEKAIADANLKAEKLRSLKLIADKKARDDRIRIIKEKERIAASEKADKDFAERIEKAGASFGKLISVNDRKSASKKRLTEEEMYQKSNVRPLNGSMRSFIDDVYAGKFNKDTEAIFILKRGLMFSENINMWSSITGWSFEKNSKNDYMITRDVELRGTYLKALGQSVEFYKDSVKPLKLEPHLGNKVLEMKDFVFRSSEMGGERIGERSGKN